MGYIRTLLGLRKCVHFCPCRSGHLPEAFELHGQWRRRARFRSPSSLSAAERAGYKYDEGHTLMSPEGQDSSAAHGDSEGNEQLGAKSDEEEERAVGDDEERAGGDDEQGGAVGQDDKSLDDQAMAVQRMLRSNARWALLILCKEHACKIPHFY